MPTPKADPPVAYVVLESFGTDIDGVPVTYRKGEPVHPADPMVKRRPSFFGPLTFPHPVRGLRTLPVPEVRAD